MTLDELRKAHPKLGVAVYAMTPGGAVTLELYENDQVYSFAGATEQEAIDKAFPPAPPPSVFD